MFVHLILMFVCTCNFDEDWITFYEQSMQGFILFLATGFYKEKRFVPTVKNVNTALMVLQKVNSLSLNLFIFSV